MRSITNRQCFYWITTAMLFALMYGCASTSTTTDLNVPPLTNSIESHNDIVLPVELKWNSDKSMAIKTDSFTGGIYHYSGRLDSTSLKDFISLSMANNKWKQVGEASYKSKMLAFIKPNKTCMVTITEGFGGSLGSTHVSLYVTVDLAAAKGLNPFGEPVN